MAHRDQEVKEDPLAHKAQLAKEVKLALLVKMPQHQRESHGSGLLPTHKLAQRLTLPTDLSSDNTQMPSQYALHAEPPQYALHPEPSQYALHPELSVENLPVQQLVRKFASEQQLHNLLKDAQAQQEIHKSRTVLNPAALTEA